MAGDPQRRGGSTARAIAAANTGQGSGRESSTVIESVENRYAERSYVNELLWVLRVYHRMSATMAEELTGRKKTGAPKGNRNRLRHGRYSLSLGALPDGCTYIASLTGALRRDLEAAVIAERGPTISLTDAGLITTICRHERHALMCQKWLRSTPGMAPETRLAFSREIVHAAERRDRAIRALQLLNGRRGDAMEQFYARQRERSQALPTTDDPKAARDDLDASAGP